MRRLAGKLVGELAWLTVLGAVAVAAGAVSAEDAPPELAAGPDTLLQAIWRRGDVLVVDLPPEANPFWRYEGAGGAVLELAPIGEGQAVLQVESLAHQLLTLEVDFGDVIVRTEIARPRVD